MSSESRPATENAIRAAIRDIARLCGTLILGAAGAIGALAMLAAVSA